MTDPRHNGAEQPIDTHSLDGQQWKGTLDWLSALPPLLNGRGAEDKVANRVLSNLASRADHKTGRNAYPSNAWLAERCHVSERSVRSALARLEDAKRIERDGLSRHGTIRWRLRFEYDVPAGWLPIDAREEHKRALAAERQRRRRAKLISEAKCVTEPAEQGKAPEAKCVTGELISEAKCVTRPDVTHLASDNQPSTPPAEETTQQTSAAAAAPTAGLDVIEAEIVEDGLPGPAGPPLLPVDPPAAELAVRTPMLPNLSAGWLLPEVLPKGKKPPVEAQLFDATEWPAPREADTLTGWTRKLVDVWAQASIEDNRSNPSGRMFAQAGREIRSLIAAGNNPNHVAMACRHAGAKGRATVTWSMQDVRPVKSWAQAKPGRQVVLNDQTITLPQGATANQARMVSLAALFPDQ